jgi:hypothetical protein
MPNLTDFDPHKAPVLTMQDDLGIVYHIESAQQFWSGGCLKLQFFFASAYYPAL